MFQRWFVGAYGVSVVAGFVIAPWAWPEASAPLTGLFFIPFSLPFALAGALVGWGIQWALERVMPYGWERTAILSCATAVMGGLEMQITTGPGVALEMGNRTLGGVRCLCLGDKHSASFVAGSHLRRAWHEP